MLHRLSPSLEQFGVHVVAASCGLGQHKLVARLHQESLSFSDVEANWRAVHEEVRQCQAPRLVISNEGFSRRGDRIQTIPRFAKLAQSLDLDVEVLFCVRPQWQWVEASYAERVRSMSVLRPFPEWLETGLNDSRVDFAGVAAPWKETFGRVTVIPVERSRLRNGLLPHILEVLGVDDAAVAAAARRLPGLNSRNGGKLLEVWRLLSIALQGHGADLQQRLRAKVLLRPLSAALDYDPPFAGLTREQIEVIVDRFAGANAHFAREYKVDVDGELFRDAPVDRFVRPTRKSWQDLSDMERQRVVDLVRRKLGVILPDGTKVRPNEAKRAGQVTFEQVAAELAVPRRRGIGDWVGAAFASGKQLLRGLGQIRSTPRALAVFRWLHWQVCGLLHRVRHLTRR